ncbi:MAG: PfkB family carbohydrate kinase [Bacteroidales bacterium]|nr:PfkB family carbohydrate kinase [Lachnoclostridium sp.]MCM1383925.1 PfkB family carbohydrate kinase [Lachnoclostridium sp.]MCM1464634.1 PfkB family carbohydrate kinase [Bacteroidales bacterium]
MNKIVTKEQFKSIRQEFKTLKRTVVLCHGVFDLVHPGHIIYFEQAKNMGDILVVSVTAAKYVRKGPGRPYFDDEMRLKFLAAIGCIDYVMLSEGFTADDVIEAVEPDLYVKGQEYAKAENDLTGMIGEEVRLVQEHGGEVAYTSGQVFSSTKLINHALPALSGEVKEYMEQFHRKYGMEDIKNYAEAMKELKVLVVGDVIIDEYIYCRVQGMMSKDMGYSARYKYAERYLGGALAIARHLASFSDNLTLMSVVGTEESLHSRMLDDLSGSMRLDLVYSPEYATIVKSRYVSVNEKREEVDKIFAVNNLPDPMKIDKETMDTFKQRLSEKIGQYDVVVLCDFGHGLVDREVMEIIQKDAKFLALNCQTNSSNFGKNIITKYRRADVFVLDQKELSLAFPDYHQGEAEEEALVSLAEHFGSHGWLTQGSKGAVCVEGNEVKPCPAFTLKVKDTIGAGDAFFALASLSVAAGAPAEVGTFMGNIAGALAANIVGNKESVEKVNVLKYASTLLNI